MSGIFNILLASFTGAGAPVGFLASITNSTATPVTDAYLALKNDQLNLSVATTDASITKLTALQLTLIGDIVWQTGLTDGADYPSGRGIAIDSEGNITVVGGKYDSVGAITNPYAVKFNNSGVVQWQNRINEKIVFNAVDVDSTNNLYCVGISSINPTPDAFIIKLNSAGAIQYRRIYGSSTIFKEETYSVAVHSTTNFVIAGTVGEGGVYDNSFSAVFAQSNGDTVYQQIQYDTAGLKQQAGRTVAAGESSGIYYLGSHFYVSATNYIQTVVTKYVTNTVSWQKTMSAGGSVDVTITSICMDPGKTHIYTCGYLVVGAKRNLQLAKYLASNGELVWQRGLSPQSGFLVPTTIATDSFDNIYVTATETDTGITNSLLLKMPGSGAGVGNTVVLNSRTYTYDATTNSTFNTSALNEAGGSTNSIGSQTFVASTAASSTGLLTTTAAAL